VPAKRARRDWSIDEKIRILAKASTLTGAELTDLLQREGVLQAEYEQWRLGLSEEGRASLATTKRIRALERELARKERALAEAAALLVLKKTPGVTGHTFGAPTCERDTSQLSTLAATEHQGRAGGAGVGTIDAGSGQCPSYGGQFGTAISGPG
jgi:hypothetical protein